MTNSQDYSGNDHVLVINGVGLHITHSGSRSVSHFVLLSNVLVVPKLTKNLVFVSNIHSNHVYISSYGAREAFYSYFPNVSG